MNPVRHGSVAIAAIGDVGSLRTWSGIPYSFWQAAVRRGWDAIPVRLDLRPLRWSRRRWNLTRLVTAGAWGGYQYSEAFLKRAEAQVATAIRGRTVISFNHQFPRARTIRHGGGRPIYYLDAVLRAELEGLGFPIRLRHGVARALAIERENLEQAEAIFTMARWLRDYLIQRCGIRPEKIHTLAGGANLELPDSWTWRDRATATPFVLGLVGTDWRRKGLPFLLEVAQRMIAGGVPTRIRVLGIDRSRLPASSLIDAPGFVDKQREADCFRDLLGTCDLGCLFSTHEAYGISILEFLRLGVPVTGFAHEGIADTIPPDAGVPFPPDATPAEVAYRLSELARDPERRQALRLRARAWSPLLTWDRCVSEMAAILEGRADVRPLQPWRGLPPAETAAPLAFAP